MKKRLFALFGILGLSLTGCGLPSIKQPTNQDQNTEQEQNQQQQEQPQEQEPVVVEHTVTFDTQGGSYLAPQKVKHGENAIRPADPTQDGYIFNDWVDENNDHWSFNGYTVTRDLTLYATWTANRHTVTFDTQGGSPVSSQTVLHGAFLKKPENPQKPGYAFVNWFGSNNNPWLFDTSIVTEDMTLYAVWDTILFNVTFESQGGTTVGGQQVAKGLYISRPADPQRQGYTFINWQDANGNVWNFDECPVTDNLVLYATWSINEYVVTFDAQGGEPIPPMTVGYNCTLSVPEIPSRDIGYGFVGWFRENGVEWDFSSDRVTENITLYAKWNLLPHTVRFYAEGATAPETQQVPHGGNATKPIDPIRPGYQLVDWVDQNGDHWSFNGYTVTKDLLLRAVWSARDYSVTFVNNDGTELDHQVLPCDSEITFQGETPIYANPDERYIYEFIGWDKPLVVPAENVVLTAQYQSTFISGKVSFYNYDESLLAEYNIVEGQPIPTYQGETPARASSGGLNYQFINWKETDDSSLTHVKYIAEYGTASNGLVFQNNSVVSYSGSTSEVVIPAKWNGYDITRIEPQAFRGNSFIQRITIPGTIKVIENWAFAECPLLSEVI